MRPSKPLKHIAATVLMYLASLNALALPVQGAADAPSDPRYCGDPVRDANGKIKRSKAELRKFINTFPCPATLNTSFPCAGWEVDHIIPLASGGCDLQVNMQWLPVAIKTCSGNVCKDRWERSYHATPRKTVTP